MGSDKIKENEDGRMDTGTKVDKEIDVETSRESKTESDKGTSQKFRKKQRHPIFNLRSIIIILLLLGLIISGLYLLRDQLRSMHQKELQESLSALATQEEIVIETEAPAEEETEEPYVSPIDFDALKEKNPDTVGWIRVPDTNIDYPIVYSGDNEKYLHRDFDGNKNIYGTIYLDGDSEPDFSGWNNPLYGHHMKDGTMFRDVVKYKEQDYFKAHQFFEIYTPERVIHLKAVSCYYTDASGIVRQTKFKSQESFDAWVDDRLSPCSYAEKPDVSVGSMFVLVTCSYEFNDARTLLYAVEVDKDGNVVPSDKEDALTQEMLESLTAETDSPETSAAQ